MRKRSLTGKYGLVQTNFAFASFYTNCWAIDETSVRDIWRVEGWGTIVGEIRGKGQNSTKGGGCKQTGRV